MTGQGHEPNHRATNGVVTAGLLQASAATCVSPRGKNLCTQQADQHQARTANEPSEPHWDRSRV